MNSKQNLEFSWGHEDFMLEVQSTTDGERVQKEQEQQTADLAEQASKQLNLLDGKH